MRSLRYTSCPPGHGHNEDDRHCHNPTDDTLRSEAKQDCECSPKSKASENKPSGDRNADETHCEKTDGNKNSGSLRVHAHDSPWAWMPIGVMIFHRLNCPTSPCVKPALGLLAVATSP